MKQEATKEIRAIYDDETIRVYQAYNNVIANEAIKLNRFGSSFSMTRMTWIKPSFLWMMYRSGYASKENQTRILAIDMDRHAFDTMVKMAVKSTFDLNLYSSKEEWQKALKESCVRVQWDPERDIYGNPSKKDRSLQLGIRGDVLVDFNTKYIKKITDITPFVHEQKKLIDANKLDLLSLPKETLYKIQD